MFFSMVFKFVWYEMMILIPTWQKSRLQDFPRCLGPFTSVQLILYGCFFSTQHSSCGLALSFLPLRPPLLQKCLSDTAKQKRDRITRYTGSNPYQESSPRRVGLSSGLWSQLSGQWRNVGYWRFEQEAIYWGRNLTAQRSSRDGGWVQQPPLLLSVSIPCGEAL